MASIQKTYDKNNRLISARVRVSCGYRADGVTKVVQSVTWRAEKPEASEKTKERQLQKFANDFENDVLNGQTVSTVKLQTFIEEWFKVHETALKPATLKKYRDCCPRIFSQLGHLRIDRVRTRDIDNFLLWLTNERVSPPKAKCKIDIINKIQGETQGAFAERCGVCAQTVYSCKIGVPILWESAEKLSAGLGIPTNKAFEKILDERKLSPKSIRCFHGFLSTVFSYAVKIGEIGRNPCLNCTLPKANETEHKIFTLQEAQRFLQLLDEKAPLKFNCYFNIAVMCGFRRGEILALRWSDIDFENHLITVSRAVHWDKTHGTYYTPPKTSKSHRTIKITERVVFLLKRLQNEQISNKLTLGDYWNNSENLVFTTDKGAQMGMSTPLDFLHRFCAENDLPQVTVHSLRHLNATLLIDSGANTKTVQSLLGHSNESTTMNIYAHEIQSAEAKASETVGALLENKLTAEAK